jgi:hypothetical protein
VNLPLTKEKVVIGRLYEDGAFQADTPVVTEFDLLSALRGLKEELSNFEKYELENVTEQSGISISSCIKIFDRWFPILEEVSRWGAALIAKEE